MKEIYTIGTSNRDLDEFIHILKSFDIELIVDVRRFPTSKFEYFKKENLEIALRKNDIRYRYLGDLLGGFREGGYQNYMENEDFKRGLEQLLSLAERHRVAILCREKFPWKCHRWLISKRLTEEGYKVIHILDEKKTYVHKTLN